MPANLTLQYLKAERDFRKAGSPMEQFECLQRMLREMPKHKGTDKLQADIKQRIHRIKQVLKEPKKTASKHVYRLPRQGAGRVVIMGTPNSGKSQLLSCLTNAHPEVAEYPFTTTAPQLAMMPWEDVSVQLVDTPPIMAEAFDPAIQDLIRGSDLALFLLDQSDDDAIQQAVELWDHIRRSKTRLGNDTCFDPNDFGVSYTRALLVLNKSESPAAAERLAQFHSNVDCNLKSFAISALAGHGIEPLRTAIFQALDVVRVYTKQPTKRTPDYKNPFTLKQGETVLDLAAMIHQDIAKSFRFARVWGADIHDGTQVKGDYIPEDRNVVEIHY